MRSALLVLTLGYLMLAAETAWGLGLQVGLVRLDGVVPLIVWYGLRHPLPGGLLPVLGLALVAETFSYVPVGLYTLAYASGYLVVRYVEAQVMQQPLWQQALLVAFIGVVVMVILLTGSGAAELVWPWGICQALLYGLTAPIWFGFFYRVEACLPDRRRTFAFKEPGHNSRGG